MSGDGVAFGTVANFGYTYPGTAAGVVADANNGNGNDVGGQSVIVRGPVAAGPYYILMQNSGYVLQENGDKIELEA